MSQSQAKLGQILGFGGGDTGRKWSAIEIFIGALSVQPAIDAAMLVRVMSVLIEAPTLEASERLKILRWIEVIEEMHVGAQALMEAHARGELGPAHDA